MMLQKTAVVTWLICEFVFSSAASAAEALVSPTPIDQHTRTLAASCAACHGTQGNSINVSPVLAGLDAHYFSAQMLAFKNGSRASTVMHHHAKGLTLDEINLLAAYFSQQARAIGAAPKPQTLKDSHE